MSLLVGRNRVSIFVIAAGLSLVLGVSVLSAFGGLPAAFASGTIVLDSTGCNSLQSGAFSSGTCDITTAITVSPGTTLIVPSGDTLEVLGTSASISSSSFSVECFAFCNWGAHIVGSYSQSLSSIGICTTEVITFTGPASAAQISTAVFPSATCSATGVPQFPIASLSSLLLIALLLPALLLIGRKFRQPLI